MPTKEHCAAYERKIKQLDADQKLLVDVVRDMSKNYKALHESHEEMKVQLSGLIMRVENSKSFVAGVAATVTTIGAAIGLFFTWWGNGKG